MVKGVIIAPHAAAAEGASFPPTHAYFGCLEIRPFLKTTFARRESSATTFAYEGLSCLMSEIDPLSAKTIGRW
jgi:hypothetical protein